MERSQGVMGRWTEYSRCQNVDELQVRLLEQANFHNFHFPIRRKGNKKRIELFPSMQHTGREWNPKDFELKRVLDLLALGEWERKITTNGQFSFYGQRLSVGVKYKHHRVSIKLDQNENNWRIYDAIGNLIKTEPSPFSIKSLWSLDFS